MFLSDRKPRTVLNKFINHVIAITGVINLFSTVEGFVPNRNPVTGFSITRLCGEKRSAEPISPS
jgi:hypothetical protein